MRPVKIPRIPPTVSKSVRIPIDVVEEVEKVIRGKECTFSAFVVEAVRIMLENLDGTRENIFPDWHLNFT